MRLFLTAALLSLLTAVLIVGLFPTRSLDDQLLRLQVGQAMPEYADDLQDESAALKALLLIYADDPVLLSKARLAVLRYPDMARPILLTYGESPVFQSVLRNYGEDVALPIHYFMKNEVLTLKWMHGLNESARAVLNALRSGQDPDASVEESRPDGLNAEQRGWYAIHFLDSEGYDFLGQFVLTADNDVGWLQTERVLEGINRFFAGGLKGLENKYRRDEPIAAQDVGWAMVDVAVGVGAFKILRLGRAGAAPATLTFSQRSAVVGAGLWRGSLVGARIVKYGAPAVLVYMAVRHPSLIHSLLATAAEKLGLPALPVQIAGWTLVLLPIFLLLRFLLAPLAWFLRSLAGLLSLFGARTPASSYR